MHKKTGFYGRVVFVAVLLIGLWQFLFADRAVVDLHVETAERSLFTIYYKSDGQGWTQRRSRIAALGRGRVEFHFRLADLRRISELRLDPLEKKGEVVVKSLTLRQDGFAPITVTAPEEMKRLLPERHVTGLTLLPEGGFSLTSTGNDPALLFRLPPLTAENSRSAGVVRTVVLILLSLLFVRGGQRLAAHWLVVPGGLLVVFTLVSVMAGISTFNQHPDEAVHAAAASYYMHYSLPPPVGDPRAEGSYSGYGVSRLYNGEIAYLLAGKFARLLAPLDLPDYIAFRAFNVMLLLVLLVAALWRESFRPLLLPLLLSPQIWYIFSYWNSEAFAVTLTMIAAWQLTAAGSSWNRLLSASAGTPLTALRLCGVGVLIALLLLCKVNFYFFLLFAGCFFLWQLVFKEVELSRQTLLRVVGVGMVALAIFGGVRLFDAWNNDFEKQQRLLDVREKHAQYAYKPSTPLAEKNPRLQLKDRGVPFLDLLRRQWGEFSFRTSVGEYGHTSVPASFNTYDLVRWLMAALAVAVVVSVCAGGGAAGISLLAITIGCSLLLMAAALYNSWTADFQAQGRYFLPMLGMFAVLLCRQRRQLSHIVTASLAALIFVTACYSFVFVALAGIDKVTVPFN